MEKEDNTKRKDGNSREESMGQFLKRTREEKGLSLKAVAEETKIRVRYLKALEEDDFASLPGEVYAKGFLRSYAKFLNIPAESLSRYKSVFSQTEGELRKKQAPVEPVRRTRRTKGRTGIKMPLLLVVVGVVLAAFLLNTYWGGWVDPGPGDLGGPKDFIPGEQEDSGTEGDMDAEEEPEEEPDLTEPILVQDTDRLGQYLLSEGPINLKIGVEESPCWVRVIADGTMVLDETMQPGDIRTFEAEGLIQFRAGNPGSLFLSINGHDLGQAGRRGVPKDFTIGLE